LTSVLVADDTKNIRSLVARCLALEGYEVSEAVDGRQAIDMLLSRAYGLALIDIKLPKASGTEVLRTIRAAGVNTPVIVITAYGSVKNAVECTHLGAMAYLHKPFTAEKLKNVLAELKGANDPDEADRLIAAGRALEAMLLLKKRLADSPLEPGVYRSLAEAAGRVGLAEDAAKYRAVYECLASMRQ
jgi:two-component system OmpR family response regulator